MTWNLISTTKTIFTLLHSMPMNLAAVSQLLQTVCGVQGLTQVVLTAYYTFSFFRARYMVVGGFSPVAEFSLSENQCGWGWAPPPRSELGSNVGIQWEGEL